MTLYGISNCDTVRKTITWLKAHHIVFDFHDYKKQGITKAKLKQWSRQAGWEKLLNKKSNTWRETPPEKQAIITNEKVAIALMIEHTSIIKRPVIEGDGKLLVGFDEKELQQLL